MSSHVTEVINTSLTDFDRYGRSPSLLLDNIILPLLEPVLHESQYRLLENGEWHAQVAFPLQPRQP